MNKKLILLVDDEPEICSELSIFLSKKGFMVVVANNGEDAVTMFRTNKPVLVISDYRMPGMDGLELLKILKVINKDVNVILMSGMADMKTTVTAMKQDAFDFLSKPIDLNELLRIVSSAITRTLSNAVKKSGKDYGIYLMLEDLDDSGTTTIIYFNAPLDEHYVDRYNSEFTRFMGENILRKLIIFDMGSMRYINNVGLNFLITIKETLEDKGFRIFMCNLQGQVKNYLSMLGYLGYFNFEESKDDVIKKEGITLKNGN